MMARLIDADKFRVFLDRQYRNCHGYSGNKKEVYREALRAVKSYVHREGQIDAVEVMQCEKYPYFNHKTNADRIRSMNDEELAKFLTHINPTNCQDCAFSHGWRCQPDKDDYSDFEKCKEGRKRWLQQPMEVVDE